MPEHTSLLHYLLSRSDALTENAHNLGTTVQGHHVGYKDFEPLFMGAIIMLVLLYLAAEVRAQYRDLKISTVPEEELTLRTFFEVFFEYFYNMAREMMGEKNAQRYFPLIGGSAIFIFVSNSIGLVPGFLPPTSSLSITAAMALIVFLAFNYYGLKENGWGYLKHLAGPEWMLAPLLFVIEVISLCVRPITLSVRLMLNMSVDHLIVGIVTGLFALLLPLPVMLLGVIIVLVQTLVFCLLTSIYIALATEHHEEH